MNTVTNPQEFDETFDVIVIGYGFAGAMTAITAADTAPMCYWQKKLKTPEAFQYVPVELCAGQEMQKRHLLISKRPMVDARQTM